MRLSTLKKRCPRWSWKSERAGFGWNYVGTRDAVSVRVYPVSVLVGEDSFETQWFVDDGESAHSFAAWWMTHGGAR